MLVLKSGITNQFGAIICTSHVMQIRFGFTLWGKAPECVHMSVVPQTGESTIQYKPQQGTTGPAC